MAARIALEPLRVDHGDEMVSVLADAELYQFTGGRAPTSESLAERYRFQLAGSGRPNETWLNWIIRRTDTAEAIGFVQADIVDEVTEIAWLIGVAHQGRGFASAAARLLIEELSGLGLGKVTAHIHPGHERSQAVATALDMATDGETDDDGEEVWTVVIGAL